MKNVLLTILTLSLAAVAVPSNAQLGMPKLGGSGGGQSNAPSADAFVQSFVKSDTQVKQSQQFFMNALGMDQEATKFEAEAKSLSGGSIDSSRIKKLTQLSNETQASIDKKMAEGAVLDAAGKVEYAKGLDSLIDGVLTAREVAGNASAMTSSLGSNPMALAGSGRAALDVAKGAPGYLNNLRNALATAMKFGEKNGVKPSADKMKAMSALQ